MAMLEVELASLSDPGRRSSNEDSLRVGLHEAVCYAVLADGAGGHRGGAIASQEVVNYLQTELEADYCKPQSRLQPAALDRLIEQAHHRLQQAQQTSSGTDRMHTTVVALWLHVRHQLALWSHVGDSRLYRLRYGAIDHVSNDDSIVQQMVQAGLITAAQALEHPARHQLLAALGIEEAVRPHTLPTLTTLEDGDAFLLCSDGWWEPLGDDHIVRLLRAAETPQAWLESMQCEIRARDLRHQDNYSAVAIWVNDPSESTRSMADPAR